MYLEEEVERELNIIGGEHQRWTIFNLNSNFNLCCICLCIYSVYANICVKLNHNLRLFVNYFIYSVVLSRQNF